jgi:hypothetical protein
VLLLLQEKMLGVEVVRARQPASYAGAVLLRADAR